MRQMVRKTDEEEERERYKEKSIEQGGKLRKRKK